MSRRPRRFVCDRIYHLISRFVDREWFIRLQEERRLYLQLLGAALCATDWRCIAFAVMSNHIHLAMIAGTQRLDRWIRRVHSPFATTMNRSYDRIGPMFVRGPKDIAVDEHGVGAVVAYIHNNPVRAGIVAGARDSTWTSHRAYVGLEPAPRWLHVQEGLARARIADSGAFDDFVRDPERASFDADYERVVTAKQEPARVLRRVVDPVNLVAATAWELGVPIARLRSSRRTDVELLAREAVVYCSEHVGVNGAEVARALGLTQQAVSKIRCRGFADDAVRLGDRVLKIVTQGVPDLYSLSH